MLQSMGSQSIGYNLATEPTFMSRHSSHLSTLEALRVLQQRNQIGIKSTVSQAFKLRKLFLSNRIAIADIIERMSGGSELLRVIS